MNRIGLLAASALVGLAMQAPAARAAAPAPDVPVACNRACYEGLVDRYLDALVAHDPSRLEAVVASAPYHFNQGWPGGTGARTS